MKRSKISISGYAMLMASCLIAMSCDRISRHTPDNDGEEYKLLTIEPTDKVLSTSYSASIKGRQDVEIRPQVSGLITEISVREGQKVTKGQPLFTLDQVPYKAAVTMARANVEVAESEVATATLTLDSKKKLLEQHVISDFDFKTAENALRSARAQLAQTKAKLTSAENDLSYTVVRSPSDGIVGTLPFRVGSLVGPSTTTPLTVVSDNSEMYVYFSLSETQALALCIDKGSLDKAIASMPDLRLRLSTGDIYMHKGKVETISGVLDKTTGAVSVRAVFPNSGGLLLSGSTGSIIYMYELKNVIVVPQEATYELQDRRFVYKIVNGATKSTEISVYPTNDGKDFVVTAGLSAGDRIVAEGAGLVKNGTKVIESEK